MTKKIIFTTLRNNKGATGGPGGVLYLQMTTLGNEINGIPCEYHFNKLHMRLGRLRSPLNKIVFRLMFAKEQDAYFFTHDIEMAALLADMNKRYSLIFHQQGPTVLEARNLGVELSENRIKYLNETERKAFVNANTLHFPSKGAAEMYFNSTYANCKKEEVNLVDPLYNIIPEVKPEKPDDFELVEDKDVITMFSLGTLTKAKGQDKTVGFIKEYAKFAPKPVRYVLVGRGPLREQLLNELEQTKKEVPNFTYYYYDALNHDAIMYLHMISDIYIMLHRISIFDFATLEAMSQHSMVVLSKVGGNLDFNMDNNVIFAEDAEKDMTLLTNANMKEMKEKNYKVFKAYFSKDAFVRQYERFFGEVLKDVTEG